MGFPLNLKYSFEGTPTKEETIQFIREDIYGELEAIALYDAHIRATSCELTKKVLTDIRDEERVHVYELICLLAKIDPKEVEFANKAFEEVKDLTSSEPTLEDKEDKSVKEQPDISSLFKDFKTIKELLNEVQNG